MISPLNTGSKTTNKMVATIAFLRSLSVKIEALFVYKDSS